MTAGFPEKDGVPRATVGRPGRRRGSRVDGMVPRATAAQAEKARIKAQLEFEAEQRKFFAEEQRKFLEEMMAQQRALRAQVSGRDRPNDRN